MRIKLHTNMAHPTLGCHSADSIIDLMPDDAIPILAAEFAEAIDPLPDELRQRLEGATAQHRERQRELQEQHERESAMKAPAPEDTMLHRGGPPARSSR